MENTISEYTETFVAAHNRSAITFALRNDVDYFALDNVSAIDVTTPSGNLLTNGNFGMGSTGLVAAITIPGWIFAQDPSVAGQTANTGVYGTTGYAAQNGDGTNTTLTPLSPSTQMFVDGAYQAYDTLAQSFGTSIGDTYSVRFWIADSIVAPYRTLDTSGYTLPAPTGDGLGHDLVLYGPDPIPEPVSLALLGVCLAGLGLTRRRGV